MTFSIIYDSNRKGHGVFFIVKRRVNILKHDDLLKIGEIDFGEPRRMTYEEMKKEFPCHFLVLKDVEYDEFHDVVSGVVGKYISVLIRANSMYPIWTMDRVLLEG